MNLPAFRKELEAAINRNSIENASDTPDWVLADYLCACLEAWNHGVRTREAYYGRTQEAVPASKPVEKKPAFEPGCCPRDGDPCENAGDGTKCCSRIHD